MRSIAAVVLVAVSVVALTGCSVAHEPTQEDLELVESLRGDLERVRADIAATRTESALYAGGLIKSILETRIGILGTTEALVEQRIHALESGAPIEITVPSSAPDSTRAASLLREIAALESDIADSRAEANRYSGGLVQAMTLSTVATQEQTLAMLQQAYLSSKYGLAFTAVPAAEELSPEEPSSSVASAPSQPAVAQSQASRFEIVEVDARVTESNSTWWKYAWKLTVKSLSDHPITVKAIIEFKDADGFVIDDDTEYGLPLQPHEERTFTGYDLIDASVARNVAQIGAKVGER